MAGDFDPYHKWLGIPPDEQPPNYYRLLAVRRFEDDPDVIAAAADQRMVHLRTYQLGQYSELSQRLLNEVAAAKVCLLSPEKKAAYDERLRQESAPVSVEELATPEPVLPVLPAPSLHGLTFKKRKQQPWLMPMAVVAALVCLGIVAIAVSNRGEKEVAKSPVEGAQERKPVVPPPVPSKQPAPPKAVSIPNTPPSTVESPPTSVKPSPQPEPPKAQEVEITPKVEPISGETVLLKDGRPLVRVTSDERWVRDKGLWMEGEGFLEGRDTPVDLVFYTELGKQNFALKLVMSLEMSKGAHAHVALHGSDWGALWFSRDGDHRLTSGSNLFGGPVDHGPVFRHIKRGVPFTITVERSGNKITFNINGQEVGSRLLREESLDWFNVGSRRGRMRLYDVTLKRGGESDATTGTQR